jgi:hypothetical protein
MGTWADRRWDKKVDRLAEEAGLYLRMERVPNPLDVPGMDGRTYTDRYWVCSRETDEIVYAGDRGVGWAQRMEAQVWIHNKVKGTNWVAARENPF